MIPLLFSSRPNNYRVSVMVENVVPLRARLGDSDVPALPQRFLIRRTANLARLAELLADDHQLWVTTG